MRLLGIPLLVLATACAPLLEPDAAPTSTETDQTTTSTTTTAPTTTTSVVDDELTTSSCPTDADGFAILCAAYDLIQQNYVDPVDDQLLVDGALAGLDRSDEIGKAPGPLTCAIPSEAFIAVCERMEALDAGPAAVEDIVAGMAAAGLDRNSVYLSPESLALSAEEQTGTVEGIGALVTTEDLTSEDPESTICQVIGPLCPLVIVSTLDGSPAEAAGVMEDDVMLRVDGEEIDGWTLDELTARVRGPAGTDVTIVFLRDGEEIEITITRAAVDIPVTSTETIGTVGYLDLNVFTGNAGDQVAQELEQLIAAGARTIVLDLRDNPGGTLNAAIDVASAFLTDGLVLRTVGPDEERTYAVRDDGVARDPGLSVVVVVNRGSASASEVVAGALQEQGRATIVGETTFGKNTVQQRFDLPNGGAIKLTIARWQTPDGRDFDDGITPDVQLEVNDLEPEELVELVTA